MTTDERFRRIALAVVLAQTAAALGIAIYMAASGKRLVVRFEVPPEPVPRAARDIIIPVAGVRAEDLRDSYGAPRTGGRAHKGVDIPAPRGTPVLAAAEGTIVKRDSNATAGLAVYQRGADGRTIYFYAHLDRWEPRLKEGDLVRQGDVIGYVGDTGNAPKGVYHLHFAMYAVTDPNRWWRGRDINPYPLLIGKPPKRE